MPADPRKRQKKLEQKAASRKAKKQQLQRRSNISLHSQLQDASQLPIVDSYVTDDVWTHGLGSVVLSREAPGGGVAFAIFLLDRYCLGVKDAMVGIESRFSYDSRLRTMRSRFPARKVTPACARNLVQGGVAYAARFGLQPHPDYLLAKLLFGDIDVAACPETFEYGKDGKPFFIAGPHDTPRRCQFILHALAQHTGGPENFHFTMPISPEDFSGDEDNGHLLGFDNEES
jgi:hypothetical protein